MHIARAEPPCLVLHKCLTPASHPQVVGSLTDETPYGFAKLVGL